VRPARLLIGHARQVAHRAEPDPPTGLIRVMLVPVAAFVVTGVVTTTFWDKPLDVGLVIWKAMFW
jgi:hypothetical protein